MANVKTSVGDIVLELSDEKSTSETLMNQALVAIERIMALAVAHNLAVGAPDNDSGDAPPEKTHQELHTTEKQVNELRMFGAV